jgi:hypothetical protein
MPANAVPASAPALSQTKGTAKRAAIR